MPYRTEERSGSRTADESTVVEGEQMIDTLGDSTRVGVDSGRQGSRGEVGVDVQKNDVSESFATKLMDDHGHIAHPLLADGAPLSRCRGGRT